MVKEGYKETEIGVIPQDWSVFSLKEITDGSFSYGVNAPAVPYAPPLPNYIRITDISDDGYFMKENRASVICKNPEMYTLNENDILFARTGASTGKTYLYRKNDGSLVYAGFLIKASISPEKANSKYVFDSLHTKRYWDWVSITSMRSGQPGINGKEYASYMVACPSLEEQQKIAEALSDMDNLISSLEKLIEKKKTIKQACLQKMFPKEGETTPEMRFPGFTEPWEQRKVTELGKIYIGLVTTMTKHYTNDGTLLIRNSDIKDGRFNFGENPIYLDTDFAQKNEARMHQIGDVITVHTGDVGTSAVITKNEDKSIGFATIVTRPDPKIIDSNYLCTYLNTDNHKEWAVSISTGDGRTNYNLGDYYGLEVPIPSIEEQKQIAEYVQHLNNLITLHQRKLEKCKKIKQGIMQQLLTGKIRLI